MKKVIKPKMQDGNKWIKWEKRAAIAAFTAGFSFQEIGARLKKSADDIERLLTQYYERSIVSTGVQTCVVNELKTAMASHESKWTEKQRLIVQTLADGITVEELARRIMEGEA
jgi:hypothetical protein